MISWMMLYTTDLEDERVWTGLPNKGRDTFESVNVRRRVAPMYICNVRVCSKCLKERIIAG